MRLRPRPRDLDSAITVVVFTVPSSRLAEMDVATGPCVPRPGKKTSLSSPLTQDGGETRELTKALYTALTGNDAKDSLVILGRSGDGVLSKFSREFLDAMADANERQLRLADADEEAGNADLPGFSAAQDDIDRAWMAAADWPRSVVSTKNRLVRLGSARVARERGQELYCWHGPAVPQFVIVQGSGGYPG
jgi:hypothetical protein